MIRAARLVWLRIGGTVGRMGVEVARLLDEVIRNGFGKVGEPDKTRQGKLYENKKKCNRRNKKPRKIVQVKVQKVDGNRYWGGVLAMDHISRREMGGGGVQVWNKVLGERSHVQRACDCNS